MFKITIGSKVKLVGDCKNSQLDGPSLYSIGIVRGLGVGDTYFVEFEKSFPGAHSCRGVCAETRGWIVNGDQIKKV